MTSVWLCRCSFVAWSRHHVIDSRATGDTRANWPGPAWQGRATALARARRTVRRAATPCVPTCVPLPAQPRACHVHGVCSLLVSTFLTSGLVANSRSATTLDTALASINESVSIHEFTSWPILSSAPHAVAVHTLQRSYSVISVELLTAVAATAKMDCGPGPVISATLL